MTIAKRIPVAGGMAGGSADAAAALVACNELWAAGLSQSELCEIGSTVGSDVAFAVLGGTAVGRGRGEQLTPALVAAVSYHWVLALADGHLSTPAVFGQLDQMRAGRDVAEPELSSELMSALRSGDAERLGAAISNDLQGPAIALFPALGETLSAGEELGALGGLVSGSGPTCYFLARDDAHAKDLAASLSRRGSVPRRSHRHRTGSRCFRHRAEVARVAHGTSDHEQNVLALKAIWRIFSGLRPCISNSRQKWCSMPSRSA